MPQKKRLYLGIDTSNYTTSAALCDSAGKIVLNHRLMLDVDPGKRGLRQSDAVFKHIKNAAAAADEVRKCVKNLNGEICAVGVSSTPTYACGSYMPCFMPGLSQAQMIAAAMDVPIHLFSHQAGHIMAALYSENICCLRKREFIAFHVSGGTTDVIKVTPDPFKIIFPEIIGGTLDISAGKVIDRIGVLMGMDFPAGKFMEAAAAEYTGELPIPLCSVRGIECNFSGLENKAKELFTETADSGITSAYVIDSIRETLSRMAAGVYERYKDLPIVFAGGVISCRILREKLGGDGRYFAGPEYSADNACGIALLTFYSENGGAA